MDTTPYTNIFATHYISPPLIAQKYRESYQKEAQKNKAIYNSQQTIKYIPLQSKTVQYSSSLLVNYTNNNAKYASLMSAVKLR